MPLLFSIYIFFSVKFLTELYDHPSYTHRVKRFVSEAQRKEPGAGEGRLTVALDGWQLRVKELKGRELGWGEGTLQLGTDVTAVFLSHFTLLDTSSYVLRINGNKV